MTITFFPKNCTFFAVHIKIDEKPCFLLPFSPYIFCKQSICKYITPEKKHLSRCTPFVVCGFLQPQT